MVVLLLLLSLLLLHSRSRGLGPNKRVQVAEAGKAGKIVNNRLLLWEVR